MKGDYSDWSRGYDQRKELMLRLTTEVGKPEKVLRGSHNGTSLKSSTVKRIKEGYDLVLESQTGQVFRGVWSGEWFIGKFEGTKDSDDNWRGNSFKLLVTMEELPEDQVLNYLNGIPFKKGLILDSIHSSLFSRSSNSYCGTYFEEKDPIEVTKTTLGVDENVATQIVNILKHVMIQHNKFAQWTSTVIKYGVNTWEADQLKDQTIPVAILGVSFEDLSVDPEQYQQLFASEFQNQWESLPALKNSVISYLENLETRSRRTWQRMVTRAYQLSKEEKYWYSCERVYFLLCCKYSPELSKLPKEVVKLICSFLPSSLNGCLHFGYQYYSTGKWSWDSKMKYLSLDPKTRTFELVNQTEATNWSYLGLKRNELTGNWTINYTQDVDKVTISFTNVQSKASSKDQYDAKEHKESPPIPAPDFFGTLTKDKERGGVIIHIQSEQLPQISLWHLQLIKNGKREQSINTNQM